MNGRQEYYLLHQAIKELQTTREIAWNIIELGNPQCDNVNDSRKILDAGQSLYSIEQSVKEARNILEDILTLPKLVMHSLPKEDTTNGK